MTEGKDWRPTFNFTILNSEILSFNFNQRILLFEESSFYESDDFFVSGKIEKYRIQIFPGHEKSLQMRVFKTEIVSVGFESIILYRSRLFFLEKYSYLL